MDVAPTPPDQTAPDGSAATAPLTIWAVSDERGGVRSQCLGLAEAVARRAAATVVVKDVRWKGRAADLPWWLNWTPRRWLDEASGVAPPWPDLWIGSGRPSLALSMRMRRWSGGKTFVVQIQDPRAPLGGFDLIVPPKHDRLSGDNVLPIIGAPHRITEKRLRSEYARFQSRLEALPHPRVAVSIGGKSRAFDLSPERAAEIARQIQIPLEQEGGSVMVTFSRRTPEAARALLTARLRHMPGVIWDGHGPNPYVAFLAAADYVLVTEDSTTMTTEAAATGKPVFVLKMDGESLKFRLFHQELERRGVTRPFGGAFHGWRYDPLAETDRAAEEILRRMAARRGS
jgi:mitochondrial fission protein ELM1